MSPPGLLILQSRSTCWRAANDARRLAAFGRLSHAAFVPYPRALFICCSQPPKRTPCRLPALAHQLGLDPAVFAARPAHIAASLAVLAAPGLLAWAADAAGRAAAAAAGPAVAAGDSPADDAPAVAPPFLRMAYGYLPLVWGGVLATYEDNLMREAGTILPATAHLLGLSAAAPALPAAAASPGAVAFAQGATLLASLAASLALTGRLAGRAPWRAGAPQVLMTAIFFGELWAVVVAN
jgi:hypothetical protein